MYQVVILNRSPLILPLPSVIASQTSTTLDCTVVESYKNPEGYAVDLDIPNQRLVEDSEYDNILLHPNQIYYYRRHLKNI